VWLANISNRDRELTVEGKPDGIGH